jgi:hypothetical protein
MSSGSASALAIACLLVACATARVEPAAPTEQDVAQAVAVLLAARPYRDPGAVREAVQTLHAFERPLLEYSEVVEDAETGEAWTETTQVYRKSGVEVTYRDGVVIGAARTKEY